VSKIFRILKTDYGSAFTANFRSTEELDEAKLRWAQKLFDVTPDQIRHGLDTMGDSHKQFPPKLNEFIEICKSMTPNVQRAHQLYISQNVEKASPEIYKSFREKIKEESGV